MHPAVLRALIQVVEGAKVYNRDVGLCGELAGDPAVVILLLGMGIDNLSMSAGSLLRVKGVSRTRARQLLQKALRYEDAASVRRLMYETLENRGLGGLVRPGR